MNTFLNAEEVARCAYLIWEREGRPTGRETEHWYQAETQLIVTRAHDHWIGGRSPDSNASGKA